MEKKWRAISFLQKVKRTARKIISLIAKTKTNRPGKPGLKYYILYPRESEVRRSVCSGADAGGSEFRHVVGDLQGEMGVNRHV